MIDFVKIEFFVENYNTILNHPELSFPNENTYNGVYEISRKWTSTPYKHLKFIVKESGKVSIHGSLHKYYNEGFHNHNDFDLPKLTLVVNDLIRRFNIDPHKTLLRNIEFGVNIRQDLIPTKEILQGLIMHISTRGHQFFKNVHIRNGGDYRQVERSQFYIKAYDKGLQYKLTESCFRFEVKTKKMEFLNKTGIKVLADILKVENHKKLNKILVEKWNEVLFYDNSIDENKLKKKQIIKVKEWANQSYWDNIYTRTCENKTPSEFRKEVNSYKRLVNKNSTHLQQTIAELIQKKCDELTIYGKSMNRVIDCNSIVSIPLKEITIRKDNVIGEIIISEPRQCKSCGRDISDQKAISKYCSEAKYGKAGKKCRDYGRTFKRYKLRVADTPLLFDISDYIQPKLMIP